MVRQYVRHRVKDYDVWRRVFDSHAELRDAGGILASGVHQGVDDPHDVTLWHDYNDVEAAKAYPKGPLVAEAMKAGGVEGEVQEWFAYDRPL